ncbi:MAG: DEAD/DEAH box helicase [Verrucomicrobia bacterium]|nr:DEAD/DEAH box helicase [Verrucomicrobiota bacterium]
MDWGGPRAFRDGQALFKNGIVERVEYEHPFIRGELSYGTRTISCQCELIDDGSVENQCPCRDSTERGLICSHVIAMGLELVRRHTDPERERKAKEELRRAVRLEAVEEEDYLDRVAWNTPGATHARILLELGSNWLERGASDRTPVKCMLSLNGEIHQIDKITPDGTLALSKQDENILFVLEDIAGGPAVSEMNLDTADFINLLELYVGKPLLVEGQDEPVTVNAPKMNSVVHMDLDHENGELILMVHTELPFMDSGSFPRYVIAGNRGWVYDAGHFWCLENLLPAPLHSIYEQPVCVGRESVPKFLQTELPLIEAHIRVDTEIQPELFTIDPAEPRFCLHVKGSPASMAATLYADYGDVRLVAGKADAAGQFAIPDGEDIMRYTVRNPAAEAVALERLGVLGFVGKRGDDLSSIIGCREVLNFLGTGLPKLGRAGWKVEMEGRIDPFVESLEFVTPIVRIEEGSGGSWFEVNFDYEDMQGQSLSEAEIQRAILKGESFVERNGRTYLIDADAITTAREVFSDCATLDGSGAGRFRMDSIFGAYVKSSLDVLDGIDVEAPRVWQRRAEKQNRGDRLEPLELPSKLDQILRPYQKEGVSWMRFLEGNGFCGILADEMGLGKTLQTLVWIMLDRADPDRAAGKPALIVCPTSLVENWEAEAKRFVPSLKVLLLSGTDRHEKWDQVGGADIVVTSYALMRRDIDEYVEFDFSIVVLDEAQHIKNRSTQNAVSAKRLKGVSRLVLTGTPVENSVSDLWSIMDFLMPGYLGNHQRFRENYELPIGRGGVDAEFAQGKLRRKLHPFLMRRMKKEVAKDLPPKIERIATCSLTKDQQMVYREYLAKSRRKIQNMVANKGFNNSRMEILKTLLRLRQTSCHLDLLKIPDLKSEYPSGKMELFFELFDEAMDAGHRVLVFSQFTSMLAILRRELDSRGLDYCYLDGATKERLKIVREFNSNRRIPAFLISLKAGGTGLNLTGADMVIHFDPWWNPAVEDQATDRAYRIGQHRTVYSIKLITKGTVEEKVLEMQKRKKDIIDATLSKDEHVMSKLTWDDVQELLTL